MMQEADFENLIRLAKMVGGKFIIVEEGQPSAVLMSYEEFVGLAAPHYEKELAQKVNDINAKITDAQLRDLREEVIAEVPTLGLDQEIEPEIRIEPLERGFDQF